MPSFESLHAAQQLLTMFSYRSVQIQDSHDFLVVVGRANAPETGGALASTSKEVFTVGQCDSDFQ